jgi:D-aspartate ligase
MKDPTRYDHPAVVLELTPTGLSVARSLGSRGIAVYGIDPNPSAIGHFSRYIRKKPQLRYRAFDEHLAYRLAAFAQQLPARPLLYCCGDPALEFAARFHALLRPRFLMPDSLRPEISGIFVNKITFYERCQALDIKLPATFFPKNADDVRALAKDLHYPAIIKPAYSHLWRKALRGKKIIEIASADELLRTYDAYCTDEQRRMITVQEVIVGPEANIAVFTGYFNRDHELVCGFTARKLRQYPPFFGSASYVESCWLPEVAELSRRALRLLGYHGIAGTEYKYDTRRKEWLLIEINPRVVLWEAIARAAGADVILASYLDMTGRRPTVNIGGQRDGVRWQYLFRDTLTVLEYLARRWAPPRQLLNYFDPTKEFAVIDMEDPAMLLMYPLYAASQVVGYGGRFL